MVEQWQGLRSKQAAKIRPRLKPPLANGKRCRTYFLGPTRSSSRSNPTSLLDPSELKWKQPVEIDSPIPMRRGRKPDTKSIRSHLPHLRRRCRTGHRRILDDRRSRQCRSAHGSGPGFKESQGVVNHQQWAAGAHLQLPVFVCVAAWRAAHRRAAPRCGSLPS